MLDVAYSWKVSAVKLQMVVLFQCKFNVNGSTFSM